MNSLKAAVVEWECYSGCTSEALQATRLPLQDREHVLPCHSVSMECPALSFPPPKKIVLTPLRDTAQDCTRVKSVRRLQELHLTPLSAGLIVSERLVHTTNRFLGQTFLMAKTVIEEISLPSYVCNPGGNSFVVPD